MFLFWLLVLSRQEQKREFESKRTNRFKLVNGMPQSSCRWKRPPSRELLANPAAILAIACAGRISKKTNSPQLMTTQKTTEISHPIGLQWMMDIMVRTLMSSC